MSYHDLLKLLGCINIYLNGDQERRTKAKYETSLLKSKSRNTIFLAVEKCSTILPLYRICPVGSLPLIGKITFPAGIKTERKKVLVISVSSGSRRIRQLNRRPFAKENLSLSLSLFVECSKESKADFA